MGRIDERELDEFDVVQNHVLGAHILREFVKFYQRESENEEGPIMALVLPVLPLVLNQAVTKSVSKRHFIEGSLIKTISEDKTLYIGLQARMEKMADQTLASLSMAFSLKLLEYDRETTIVQVLSEKAPKLEDCKNYRDMLNASRRLGSWFAKLTFQELVSVFKIYY